MKLYILSEYDVPFTALDNVIGEVIMCKDCKAYNGMKCVRNNMIAVRAGDFCSRAERKEE